MRRAVHATAADLPTVQRILREGFANDPVTNWLLEPAADRLGAADDLWSVMVRHYFRVGHTYLLEPDGRATALWAPPDVDALREEAVGDIVQALGPHLGDALGYRLSEAGGGAGLHPPKPYWFLGFAATDPSARSQGFGSEVLAPVLDECDASRQRACLESSNPRNIPFYMRLGFRSIAEHRCGGDGPVLTVMIREPG